MKLKFKGFDWDEGNKAKCQKHGVAIRIIEQVFFSKNLRFMPDLKHSWAEDRFIAIASVDERHVFVVFTERDKFIRPVSARYMHKDEVEYYEENH